MYTRLSTRQFALAIALFGTASAAAHKFEPECYACGDRFKGVVVESEKTFSETCDEDLKLSKYPHVSTYLLLAHEEKIRMFNKVYFHDRCFAMLGGNEKDVIYDYDSRERPAPASAKYLKKRKNNGRMFSGILGAGEYHEKGGHWAKASITELDTPERIEHLHRACRQYELRTELKEYLTKRRKVIFSDTMQTEAFLMHNVAVFYEKYMTHKDGRLKFNDFWQEIKKSKTGLRSNTWSKNEYKKRHDAFIADAKQFFLERMQSCKFQHGGEFIEPQGFSFFKKAAEQLANGFFAKLAKADTRYPTPERFWETSQGWVQNQLWDNCTFKALPAGNDIRRRRLMRRLVEAEATC